MIIIHNAIVVNEGRQFKGGVIIDGEIIKSVFKGNDFSKANATRIDAKGGYLIPGAIDDQVHFREPGLTHKAEILTESRAAAVGGITTFFEMPNTQPQTLTQQLLKEKYDLGAQNSFVNYGFMMGASNNNLKEILQTDLTKVPGLKIFMGSSTGNMLVDQKKTLEAIFKSFPGVIALHCEQEDIIKQNQSIWRKKYGENVNVNQHPLIRNAEACYASSATAVELADKFDTRIHVFHISTAKETKLFSNTLPLEEKKITAEVCIHHLYFSDEDYAKKGAAIKWNPAVKSKNDRQKIWEALLDDRIDVIATDHAPHTWEEKQRSYFSAPAGGPMVQHSVPVLFDFAKSGQLSVEKVVQKIAHHPAVLFRIEKRGFIRKGYFADLAIVKEIHPYTVKKSDLLYKCGWSPLEGDSLRHIVTHTLVNGNIVVDNGQIQNPEYRGKAVTFKQ